MAEHQRDADLHGGLLEGECGAAVRPRDQEHQQRRGWVCQCPRFWLAAAACDVATLTGVETRIPGFGNTTNVEWIDKSMRSFSTYFALIVSKLLPEVRLLFKHLELMILRVQQTALTHGINPKLVILLDYECSMKIFQGLRSRREHPRSSI